MSGALPNPCQIPNLPQSPHNLWIRSPRSLCRGAPVRAGDGHSWNTTLSRTEANTMPGSGPLEAMKGGTKTQMTGSPGPFSLRRVSTGSLFLPTGRLPNIQPPAVEGARKRNHKNERPTRMLLRRRKRVVLQMPNHTASLKSPKGHSFLHRKSETYSGPESDKPGFESA